MLLVHEHVRVNNRHERYPRIPQFRSTDVPPLAATTVAITTATVASADASAARLFDLVGNRLSTGQRLARHSLGIGVLRPLPISRGAMGHQSDR